MDEEALIKEVLENPELEAPRLVYADWLEERGDQRAEFLRLECEFNRFDFDHSAAVDLKADLLELWEKLDCPEWLNRVGTKYNVWLINERLGRLMVVKMIRMFAQISLKDAIDRIADKGPSRILWGLDLPKAEASLQTIRPVASIFPLSKLITIVPSWREPPQVEPR